MTKNPKMKLLHSQSLKLIVTLSITFAVFFSTLVSPPVYAQSKLAAPTSHVSDTAGVVNEPTKQQLENILANLQQRSGVNLTILTVPTTGGVELFDYSAKVAREWDIGSKLSATKSLLLVVSVEERTSIVQFSRRVQKDLPEGALADLNEQMRGPVSSGHVAEALLLGVQKLMPLLAGRLGFSAEGMDQPLTAQAAPTTPVAASGDTAGAAANPQPTPTPNDEPKPAATTTPSVDDVKTISDPKSQISNPGSEISDRKSQSAEPAARKKESAAKLTKTSASKTAKKNTPEDDEAEAEQVEEMSKYPVADRVDKLKDFITTHPDSKSKARATEMLIVARAALGDNKLKAGETAAGVELLFMALGDAPPDMPDRLFSGVVAQIPLNLYVRGQASESLKAAQQIEAKVAGNPKRLLALSGFYLEIERGDEAARIAEQAVKLAPDLAEAHNALALALHISLRLDEAAAEYKRALELDPKTRGVRRALADLDRAAGKFEEALALYREQLTAEPDDNSARVGLVLSLFELGKIDEAKQELQAAIDKNPRNLSLLAGASYWLVAHGEGPLALALAQKAVDIEPRYTWAQIALARSLIAQKQPLYAERSLRYARQFGKFPTLDYELASTLASLGLYEEASEVLAPSFALKDGQIETLLANRYPAHAAGFIELLSLERRASIFQPASADTEDNARILKALLAFTLALNPQGADARIDESSATAAAREFAAGKDDRRAFRQLYAVSRLLKRGIAFQTAFELSEAARDGVDAAIFVPAVTVAVQADELGDIRARAIASGGTPDIPEAPRNVLANILRGRIEESSGWALFNLDKTPAAIERLRRAVGILPVSTPLWQTACWHLGVALQEAGNNGEALAFYIKSYTAGVPDPVRRGIIEQLYKKVNGSLDGLDDRIGPAAAVATATPSTSERPSAEKGNAPLAEPVPTPIPTAGPTPTPTPDATVTTPEAVPQPKPSPSPSSEATPTPTSEPTPSPSPTPASPEATPTPTPTPTPDSTPAPPATPTPEATPTPAREPTPSPTPVPETTTPTPSPTPASDTRPRRVKPPR